jgi:hypothetical protein
MTTPENDYLTLIFACRDHAPIGVSPEPNDDGRPTCTVCGVTNYAVKPFVLKTYVAERGLAGREHADREPTGMTVIRSLDNVASDCGCRIVGTSGVAQCDLHKAESAATLAAARAANPEVDAAHRIIDAWRARTAK